MAQFGPAVQLAEGLANVNWGIPAMGYWGYRAGRYVYDHTRGQNNNNLPVTPVQKRYFHF